MKRKILPGFRSFMKLAALGLFLQCFQPGALLAKAMFQEEVPITGVVSDSETKEAIPGVSVIVKGTTKGTVTDADGRYRITADRSATLVFSFVGYDSYEVTVHNSTDISVALVANSQTLNEVIVTGYSSQSKRAITGAVSSVTAKDLPDGSQVSMERSLQGKVAGVYVSSEGTPGGNTMVRIRGFGTTNNNDPLYIIDGVPTQGNLSSLSPSDIESMTVLKDASAASIYGSRAANGVIIVTTKKGSAGKPQFKVQVSRGVASVNPNRFPKMMSPKQLADAYRDFQINGTGTFNHPAYGTGATAELPDFVNPIGFQQGNDIVGLDGTVLTTLDKYDLNDNDGDGAYQVMRANKQGTNWFKEIFQNAAYTNVNMSYGGGSDKGTYYIGSEYFDQEGVVIHTNFKRYAARINSVGNITNYLRIGQNLNVVYTEGTGLQNQYENGVLAMVYRIPSIIPVYDVQGNFAGNQSNKVGNARNPVAELTRNKDNKNRTMRTFGNAYLEADLLKGLKAKTSIGIDYSYNNTTAFTAFNPGDYESVKQNSFTETNAFNSSITWSNTLNYAKDFGQHSIDVLGGMENINSTYRASFGTRNNYVVEDVSQYYLGSGTGAQTNGNPAPVKFDLLSYFGKVNYDYGGKYLASFTIRRDGSSRFPENSRWGTFPAASIGWVVTEEPFLKGLSTLSSLKLRAGWGQVGNQNIPDPNGANTFFGPDVNYASYPITGSNTAAQTGFRKLKRGNPGIKWETTETINLGVDADLFKNALNVSFEWYQRETKDMLVDVVQPATAGAAATNAFLNVGNVMNKGIELALNYNSQPEKAFRYSLGVNFSTYRNVVNKLNSAPFFGPRAFDLTSMTITKEGEAISSFYGFVIDGVFKDQADVDKYAETVSQEGARPGTFKMRDVNHDGVINDLDRTVIGSPHPKFMYGFNVNLYYKNFEFTMTGTGVYGNKIFNATRYFTDFFIYDGNKSTRLLDAWTPTNTDTNIPQLNSNMIVRAGQESTYYIEDGSFMRIRNIQLSYNFPKKVFGNALTSAKLYVQGQNLFTFTKYSGLDPEINLTNYGSPTANRQVGVDKGAYPIARTYSVGLIVNF